jgi:hypothetical protein
MTPYAVPQDPHTHRSGIRSSQSCTLVQHSVQYTLALEPTSTTNHERTKPPRCDSKCPIAKVPRMSPSACSAPTAPGGTNDGRKRHAHAQSIDPTVKVFARYVDVGQEPRPRPIVNHSHSSTYTSNRSGRTPARFQACDDVCPAVELGEMGMHAGCPGGCDSWD